MVVVSRKKGKTKDSLFREFSKTVYEENIADDIRSRMFYKKPSLVRKEEEKERLRGGKNRLRSRKPLKTVRRTPNSK